ncbi:MAG: metallophosphoesterase [Verrucomicrobiaceae bacterium]
MEKRRTFLKRLRNFALAPLAVGGGSAYGYGSLIERHGCVVESLDVTIPLGEKGPPNLRAVLLSDFHFDPLHETGYVEHCIRLANELRPDVAFFTGDFITSHSRRIDDLAQILGRLQTPFGTFACLGNHDYVDGSANIITQSFNRQGIEILQNQHTRVECGHGEILVAGLQSAWSSMPSWPLAAMGLQATDRAIVLIHEPDYAKNLRGDQRIALQLSGHTHGGQVCLPGLGPLRLPPWGKKYAAGYFDADGVNLYVTRGIGTMHLDLRLFCPPEITCLNITNADVRGTDT